MATSFVSSVQSVVITTAMLGVDAVQGSRVEAMPQALLAKQSIKLSIAMPKAKMALTPAGQESSRS